MDTYIIKKAYHWSKLDEIEIQSDNLLFAELAGSHSGCQSTNIEKNELIRKKCTELANLIREIDKLNRE